MCRVMRCVLAYMQYQPGSMSPHLGWPWKRSSTFSDHHAHDMDMTVFHYDSGRLHAQHRLKAWQHVISSSPACTWHRRMWRRCYRRSLQRASLWAHPLQSWASACTSALCGWGRGERRRPCTVTHTSTSSVRCSLFHQPAVISVCRPVGAAFHVAGVVSVKRVYTAWQRWPDLPFVVCFFRYGEPRRCACTTPSLHPGCTPTLIPF